MCLMVLRMIAFFFTGLLLSTNCFGLEVLMSVSSNGTLANVNIYGTSVDTGGNVTNWGSNFRDYVFMLKSNTGSNIVIDQFAVQISANPGVNTTATLNASWFNWVNSSSQTNPSSAAQLGEAVGAKGSFNAFADALIGPANFTPSSITVTPSGSYYFFRVWTSGPAVVTGYGTKMVANSDLSISFSSSNISMYNYNGSTFSTTPAQSFTPVPEPSTCILSAISFFMLVGLERKRKLLRARLSHA